jgi:hypothetical protein
LKKSGSESLYWHINDNLIHLENAAYSQFLSDTIILVRNKGDKSSYRLISPSLEDTLENCRFYPALEGFTRDRLFALTKDDESYLYDRRTKTL